MAECIPDRNWLIVKTALEDGLVPKDAFLAKVCDTYKDRKKNEKLAELIGYIENDYYKDTLVAFFLSGMPVEDISKTLRMDLETLSYFEYLVVNPAEFRSKLDIFWYAGKYVEECENERGKEIVKSGVQLGPSGLTYQFMHGNEEIEIDTKKIARSMLQASFVMTQLVRGNSITSAQSKEALKTMGIASKLIKEAERVGADTTEEAEAILAIEERKAARTPTQAGIPVNEILH